MTPVEALNQVKALTVKLVELGLSDMQNFPVLRDGANDIKYLTIPGAPNLSIAMKNLGYGEIYAELARTKSFNIRMLDGALVQFLYTFSGNDLIAHRLAYFPSPDLETFQSEPDLYLDDEIFADILKKNIVPFPVRFDFDASDEKHIDVRHPKSHLTLGQYQNCRIPMLAPLSPIVFIKFLLQHFYNTAYLVYEDRINLPLTYFQSCITANEKKTLHVSLPVM
jgi:hypothetical protein